ncbi:MAG: elongation factor G [Ignavibacteriales bacterium]|nr:elongation factor G [Ignavibacteriales bacterium]
MAQAHFKEYSVDKIRNVSLIGHGGSGKTTLTEALLFTTGTTNRLGKVDDGSTVSDYHPDEIERKISINASLLHAEWQGTKVNVLDTPGYSDFIGEVLSSLRVSDTAVVLVKAVEGAEVGTEIVWNYAREYKTPTLVLVNKLDNENAEFDHALSTIRERFGHDVTVVQFPVNQGLPFDSVVDVLRMKLLKFNRDGTGKFTESDIPADLKQRADALHEELIEKIAETDEELMNKFFEDGTLKEPELQRGMRVALLARKIFPVFCAASSMNVGTVPLIDFLINYAPSPKDRGEVTAKDLQAKKEISVAPDAARPPAVFVFKTVSEQHVGELSYFRVYSGAISPGMDLLNETNGKTERLGQVFLMNGKERREVGKLLAGDIGAVVKLRDTHTNNTLSSKAFPVEFPPIQFPDPVIRMAIVSKSKGDEDRIATGLHYLHEEDPTFVVQVDAQLSQTVIAGQGELHLLIVTKRLKEKYGVDVDLAEPRIPYKETIKGVVPNVDYKHKKQTGGRGQFGHVYLKIEPKPRGTGFEFEDAIVGGVVPGRFVPAVEKGIVDIMHKGVIAGYEVVDVKVTLHDGSYHTVDSDELSFKIAGSMAFKKGFMDARPVILEPINEVEVVVPEEYMGDVMGDLSARRGKIQGMETEGPFQKIKALIPMAELHKYSTILRSMTQGRGIYRTKFSHYDELPREQAEKVIAAHDRAKVEAA